MGAEQAVAELVADAFATQAAGEILEVVVGLEADEIVMREPAHDLLMHRHGEEHIGRRPGDVQEEADLVLEAHLAQFGGQRDQMVVVDPDDVVRLDQRRQPVGEEAVDAEIAGHFLAAIFGKIQPVMADRPENTVGKAVVIFLDVGIGQIRQRVGDLALLVSSTAVPARCRRSICRTSPSRSPPLRFERDLQGNREAACRCVPPFSGTGTRLETMTRRLMGNSLSEVQSGQCCEFRTQAARSSGEEWPERR